MLLSETECKDARSKRRSGDPGRNQLILECQDYVDRIADHLIRALGLPREHRDELISAGYLGLVEASGRYDASSPQTFRQYSFLRIRGAIIDSLRKSSDLSPGAYRYARALDAANELQDTELEECGDTSVSDRQRLARVLEYAAQGALAYRLVCSGAELDEMQTTEETPESSLIRREQRNRFRRLVDRLPEKERIIIKEYYFRGKPFRQIAEEQDGISKSWVSRLHSRALSRLRTWHDEGCDG